MQHYLFSIPTPDVPSALQARTGHYGAGNFVTNISDMEKIDYERYLEMLEAAGFVKYADNGKEGLAQSVFTSTYTRDNAVLTVIFRCGLF